MPLTPAAARPDVRLDPGVMVGRDVEIGAGRVVEAGAVLVQLVVTIEHRAVLVELEHEGVGSRLGQLERQHLIARRIDGVDEVAERRLHAIGQNLTLGHRHERAGLLVPILEIAEPLVRLGQEPDDQTFGGDGLHPGGA